MVLIPWLLAAVFTAALAACVHWTVQKLAPSKGSKKKTKDQEVDDDLTLKILNDTEGWADDDDGEPQIEDEKHATVADAIAANKVDTSAIIQAPAEDDDSDDDDDDDDDEDEPLGPESGPRYSIGDRVVLSGLKHAKHLNYHHGTVTGKWDKDALRYPITLDLIPKPITSKVENLIKEAPLVTRTDDDAVFTAQNGVLNEVSGRICAFIFTTMRGLSSQILQGNKDAAALTAFGWQFWKTVPGQGGSGNNQNSSKNPQTLPKGVYLQLLEFLTRGILLQNKLEDLEKQLSPKSPKGSYLLVKRAMTSDLAVASWNVRLSGEFWVIGDDENEDRDDQRGGTLVIPCDNPKQVYRVVGYQLSLWKKLNTNATMTNTANGQSQPQHQFPRPPKFFLTLLPWFGYLIHDPILLPTTGTNQVELASPKQTKQLLRACDRAKKQGRIVDRFCQLELEKDQENGSGFSNVGVPFDPKVVKLPQHKQRNLTPPDFSKMPPATEQERSLVDNLTNYEPIPLPPPQAMAANQAQAAAAAKVGAWNFIRLAETIQENPKHEGMIMSANGQQVAQFTLENCEKPTPIELLQAMLKVCAKINRRPHLLGIDHDQCCRRMQFLLQGVPQCRVARVQVNRKKTKQLQQPSKTV